MQAANQGVVTIKGRLLALVLIAAFPVILLDLWNELERRAYLQAEAAAQALRAARLIAAEQDQYFETARTVLTAYLAMPQVRNGDWEACNAYLARLIAAFPHYTGFGVATPDGIITCSSNRQTLHLNIAGRDYFREVMLKKSFAVGGVMWGGMSGRKIIGLAQPLLDPQKTTVRLIGVLGLDLERWSSLIAGPELPPETTVIALDAAGTVMARVPNGNDWIAQPAPEALRQIEAPGVREVVDPDGQRRLYGLVPLLESERIVIGVGLPVAPVFDRIDRLFWREIALLSGVFLLVGIIAWIGSEATIHRPLADLQAAIDRIRAGDLGARSSTATRVPEFVRLGRSFDAMAETLERREAELYRALADKELLLREMNHRVKNSLQLIASMLSLPGVHSTDPELRRHLAEARTRVLTVARVHERLYRTDRIASVEFAQYLRDLCDEIAATLPEGKRHSLVVDAEPGELPMAQAVPFALIANELVTNAVKYAYPDGSGGVIKVHFGWGANGGRRLEVIDHGIGLPKGFDLETSGSLGMRLVRALAQQLRGRLEIERGMPGVRFAVSIPG